MRLRHARVELELHVLSERDGPALLLLHQLGGSSADWGEVPALWPGRVFGLDFSGHGASQGMRGGVYQPELLAGDADAALAEIGPAALAGAGIGAYVTLLLAGGRADLVPAALLLSGRGLDGGGAQPNWDISSLAGLDPAAHTPLPDGCDPRCCVLETDPRPPDYAAHFGRAARRLLRFEDGTSRPPWWAAAGGEAVSGTITDALRHLAGNG
ncbi:MAG: alpha/beta hydrolase [bacterium]